MTTKLIRAPIFFNFVRYKSIIRKKIRWRDVEGKPEGVRYEKITYYPRHPDHIDPPFQPSKLLLVTMVKPFVGNPWWDKKTLETIGFVNEKHVSDPIVIVKNTPEMCAKLWKVKHLIKIVPIKLPDKLPMDDLNGTYLHENGTFYVVPKVDPAREEAVIKFINDPKKLNRDLIQEKLRHKWNLGIIM